MCEYAVDHGATTAGNCDPCARCTVSAQARLYVSSAGDRHDDLALAVVEREARLAFLVVPLEDERDLAVHHLAVDGVVVLRLDDARADA